MRQPATNNRTNPEQPITLFGSLGNTRCRHISLWLPCQHYLLVHPPDFAVSPPVWTEDASTKNQKLRPSSASVNNVDRCFAFKKCIQYIMSIHAMLENFGPRFCFLTNHSIGYRKRYTLENPVAWTKVMLNNQLGHCAQYYSIPSSYDERGIE